MTTVIKKWVRVPQVKGKLMCSVCGRRGIKYVTPALSFKGKHVTWCSDTGKSCQVSARHCEGAFIREDKVKKVLKEWEMLYGAD